MFKFLIIVTFPKIVLPVWKKNKFFLFFFQNVQKTSMTTILEAGTMHCNSAKMASAEVKSEVNYDTVRQTLRETIR